VSASTVRLAVDEFGHPVSDESPDFVYYATLLSLYTTDLAAGEFAGTPVGTVTFQSVSLQPFETFDLPTTADGLASLLSDGTRIQLTPTTGQVRFVGTLESVTPIPEPSSAALLALGLAVVAAAGANPPGSLPRRRNPSRR